jgi:hypothetical protein
MEFEAVVESARGELLEIGNGFGRFVIVQLHADITVFGCDCGSFHVG